MGASDGRAKNTTAYPSSLHLRYGENAMTTSQENKADIIQGIIYVVLLFAHFNTLQHFHSDWFHTLPFALIFIGALLSAQKAGAGASWMKRVGRPVIVGIALLLVVGNVLHLY
ncbi:hypothetical protein MF271_05030 [Deinococcus sp. KNUC1210]|uniref:hypothetical protein n=1 Tax=Deinococcus sp. KNUC1210 TaxID=2917691 RepID=UPI001EEFCDDB|nr:hypothetical protein [Deinococcus sp. KNUC1210]ULH15999.1 hypothetical protein MF271_05030 [Deinococcus sp. KNUC1210]